MSNDTSRFYKTKVCKKFIEKGICLNSINCLYAHSIEELRHPHCFYFNNCKNRHSTCQFIHKDENVNEYRMRIGFDIPSFPTQKEESDEDEEDIDIILNDDKDDTESTTSSGDEKNEIVKKVTHFRPIELDSTNEMSYYWGLMAIWSKRDIKWVK
jgi:hypothetical protein